MTPAPRAAPTPDLLVQTLLPLVLGWCSRLAPPGVDHEAAAHDALIILLRRREELIPGAPLAPWAYGVTTRVVRAHARRAWLRRWLPGQPDPGRTRDTPHSAYHSAERSRQVHAVLSALRDAHREVLVLCDVEERSRAEVAEILGVPEGTIKSRLRLAREAFRQEAARCGWDFPDPAEHDHD